LPPPLHLLPGLLALPGLTVRDRLLLATAFGRMAFAARRRERLDHLTFAQWLGRTTSPTLDRGFWRLMLTSVLNADADQASAAAGLMFFLDGLMRHRDAFTLGVPRVPLSVLHHDAVLAHLAKQDAEVRLRATARVVPTAAGPRVWIDGAETSASAAVVAVRWTQLGRVLPRAAARALAAPAVERLRGEAIVGLHLWFAEPVTSAPVTGLLAQDVDWVFASEGGRRLSVVVSAAEGWRGLSRVALVERCLTALRRLWPDLPAPLRAVACREGEATFVPAPGLAALRPAQRTPWPGVALAGAWTRTGWPATQEGAVRSGYLAAEALLGQPVLAPDLPAQGLLRLVGPTC
jgi:zeta-carotene desaturase